MSKYLCLSVLLGLALFPSLESQAGCRLPEAAAPLVIPLGTICIEGSLGGYGLGVSNTEGRSLISQSLAKAYLALYGSSLVSLHGKFYAKDSGDGSAWDRTSEQAFVQLGHPLDHRLYGALGLVPMPFGVNHDLYGYHIRSRGTDFWGSAMSGFRLSLRVRDDLRFEAGGGSKERQVIEAKNIERIQSQTLAVRLTKLTDLLSGTKLVASYQANSALNTRKLGLATLVYNELNLSSLEWARITEDTNHSFLQLFRFSHEQILDPWRWNLVYEDIKDDSYRLSLGGTRQFLETWSLNFSLHYQRLRRESAKHGGYALFGFNYGLTETFIPGGMRAFSE